MKVLFSGLCAFAGWPDDDRSPNPVQVILTKSDEVSPHQPLIAIPSHFVLQAERTDVEPGVPAFADFAFVGPGGVEFVAWHLPRRLTLPENPGNEVKFAGTDNLVDLGRLCEKGDGSRELNLSEEHIAMRLVIKSGQLTADAVCQDNPSWVFIADDADGNRKTIGPKDVGEPKSMKIADHVEYLIPAENAAPEGYRIEFGDPDPTVHNIRLRVNALAQVWVTNLSRQSQPSREKPTATEADHLEDVLMHYKLYAAPPEPRRRFVPILSEKAENHENSTCCVKECVRL